jgi:hypothetical protein
MLDNQVKINIRYKEQIRYIRTNNSISAYAAHILENRHEYGNKENTLQLLKVYQKIAGRHCKYKHFINKKY